ncbi:MAG: stage II sporulation protein M [Candidatus Micrarchaeota archaeon]
MVVESLIGPRTAERNPTEIIVLAFIFVSMAVGVVDFLKIEPYGAMLLLFTLMPAVPFILNLFKLEEEELEHETIMHSRTIRRHFSVVLVLLAFFAGLVIGFTFWYLFLQGTDDIKAEKFFDMQLGELQRINDLGSEISGKVLENEISGIQAGAVGFSTIFNLIFYQNLKVLLLVILGSLLYGAGSVFILIWNASVIGVFLGNVARKYVFHEAPAFSLIPGLSYGILGLIPHGSFELISYSIGALAGGILSAAIARRVYGTIEFRPILMDVIKLVLVAVILLFVGAIIESATF